MRQIFQIFGYSFKIAFQELKSNKLRTILSLSGVSVGIFCIVAVFTVLDSMEQAIKENVSGLGSDVLYVSKWPWMDDDGTYKWWEYLQRPVMTTEELNAINDKSQTANLAALFYRENGLEATQGQFSTSGITGYAVTDNFEKMQSFDLAAGRYLSQSELAGGQFKVVLGHDVYEALFPNREHFENSYVNFLGHKFQVIGVMKKAGSQMTGMNYDHGMIYPYFAEAAIKNVNAKSARSTLMVQAKQGIPIDELSSEVEGILRAVRKQAPGERNNFSLNRLSQITERLNSVFVMINVVGSIIAFFSLLVGGFGIANIMFVTVKERTRIIGIKKAVGAPSSAILFEFLTEAVILCILGGLMGIISIMILGLLITYVFDFTILLSLNNFLIGISISTVVGLISGYIPARSAARLNPVVAIRTA